MKHVGVKVWKRGYVMCLFKDWENRKIKREFYTNLCKLTLQRGEKCMRSSQSKLLLISEKNIKTSMEIRNFVLVPCSKRINR